MAAQSPAVGSRSPNPESRIPGESGDSGDSGESRIPNPESRIPGDSGESRIPNPESRSGYDPWDPPSLGRVDTRVTSGQPTFARKGMARASASTALMAPMPATVIRVQVKPGDAVSKGDIVLVLEAMKMELPIRALGEGIVAAVHCREGELVQPDTALVEFIDPSRA